MAIDRNIAIALQIRTDLNKARADIDALDRSVEELGATGKATGGSLGDTGKKIDDIGQRAAKVGQELNAAGAKLRSFEQGTAKVGVSAGQTANAMRQLPAQITDIVTGLVGGQSAFQVFIQQGGQLRDSFGSVGGVLRGFASVISPATIAVGGLVAVVGTLALGLVQGYLEAQRLGNALVSTGGYAGRTTAQLAELSNEVGEAQHAYGDAAEAVQLLAASGRVSTESLDDAARGAVAFAQLTGASIDDAVAKVVALSERPVQAVRALDEQYHFLETSIYAQIRALQEQGNETEAAALAQHTFADAMEDRRQRDVANLGTIQKAWAELRNEVSKLWTILKDFGSADIGAQIQLLEARRTSSALNNTLGAIPFIGSDLIADRNAEIDKEIAALKKQAAAEQEAAKAEADHRKVQEDGNAALDRIAASTTKYATAADRYKKELDDINKNFDTAIKAMPEKADELNAQRAGQIKSAVNTYAEKLQQESRAAAAAQRAAERKAEAEAQAATNAHQGLLQSLAQMQGELDPTAAAWVRYNQAVAQANEQADKAKAGPRANAAAINAERDATIALAAVIRDAALDKLAEKDRKAWEALRESLRTPTEVKVETAIDQIKQLNGFLANGTINAQQYHDALQRVGTNSVVKAPQYQGVDASIGGPAGELGKSFKAQTDLETWHTQQLAANEAFRQQDLANEEVYQARKAEIEQQYAQQRTEITQAQQQLALAAASDGFANLAGIAKAAYGEQSAQYRALFALSKAFAIAQAAISLGINVAKASETGFPYNIGFIAGAIAQGVQIASIIAGANFSGGGGGGSSSGSGQGFAEGGYTGPGGKYQVAGYVHAGEGVLSQEDIASLGGPAGFHALRSAIQSGSFHMPGYADGGFVSPMASAPRLTGTSAPRAQVPEGQGESAGPVVHNNFKFLTSFDANDLAEKILSTPAGERLIVHHVVANGSTVKQGLG